MRRNIDGFTAVIESPEVHKHKESNDLFSILLSLLAKLAVNSKNTVASGGEPVEKVSQVEDKELVPLTTQQLAQRFCMKPESVTQAKSKKTEAVFLQWSASKDPDGLAWHFDVVKKLFSPVRV
jgi:hypothetical protein